MDSKGGNPFLIDDYSTDIDITMKQVSNPFLQDFGDAETTTTSVSSGIESNPFFNFVADQSYQAPSDLTNPFASFGVEASVPEPETSIFINPEAASIPSSAITSDSFNIEPLVNNPIMTQASLISTTIQSTSVTSSPSKPSRPPPPPRPGPPPPPRNTKDLILSVTGAMDETSNQMLDRLQATRTPSPTLMHSPSPTPEHSLADFVDIDGSVSDLIHDNANENSTVCISNQGNILNLLDSPPIQVGSNISENIGTETVITTDMKGLNREPITTCTLSNNLLTDIGEKEVGQSHEINVIQMEKSLSTNELSDIVPTDVGIYQSEAETPLNVVDNMITTTPAQQSPMFYSTTQALLDSDTVTPGTTNNVMVHDLEDVNSKKSQHAMNFSASHMIVTTECSVNNYRSIDVDSNCKIQNKPEKETDAFDVFASKFDRAAESDSKSDIFFDPFTSGTDNGQTAMDTSSDVWGDSMAISDSKPVTGFDEGDGFDSFLSMVAPPPDLSRRRDSGDSEDGPDFSVIIKPKQYEDQMTYGQDSFVPALAPPPKSPLTPMHADSALRFNPFDKSGGFAHEAVLPTEPALPSEMSRTDSQETPPTPLFDEDISQPLENFPRTDYTDDGWEMQLRQPIKKKITGQRFWKKIFLKLVYQGDNPVVQLFNKKGDKDPFQELPLLACYSVSDIMAQQFDQYGKIFTVKLQYIFYKERPGVRPGQVTKAERITTKLSQFAAYAIQGDLQGVKEFGSDLKKLGIPVEHAPQISQLFKLGSQTYEDMKTFSVAIEEALFKLQVHRDRAFQYKIEEVQISVVDELYVEQDASGHIEKQIARVRLFFLGFLSGMPDVELGINDIWRQGKEVVGRHDIIPVPTEEWIRLENIEFHSCIQQEEYQKSRIIKFKPPDACYIELMRFRIRPPRNRELPLQLKAVMCVTGNKVELRADILVPGFASRKLGRVPCEDVMVRFPIPECWIYLFRVEKHFRYGSVKSAHRRTGKIKGIERFLGAVDTLEPQLMEVTSGQAKYEHQHHAIVWRMPRLPKEGQGAYSTHQLVCRMNLTSYDQIPEKLSEYCYVEFTMPATQVSHTMARSVSFQNFDSDVPPEKCVRNLSRHEYRVGIEHTQGEGPGAYVSATSISTPKKTIPELTSEIHEETTDRVISDSDSSD